LCFWCFVVGFSDLVFFFFFFSGGKVLLRSTIVYIQECGHPRTV